jgi:hypothetical protein
MSNRRIVLVLLVCFFSADLLNAQAQFTGWLASFNTIKTGKKTSLHLDVQLRSNDEIRQIQSFLFRPGINLHLKNNFTVTAGYAFILNRNTVFDPPEMISEHRTWEQLLFTHKFKKIAISHRFRVEQRFLPRIITGPDGPEKNGYLLAGRARYFVRGILPLKKQEKFSKGIFAALQNELFLNFIDRYKVNGKTFDQNRLYLATGYRLSPKADLEIGYLNQYVNGRGSQFTNNHVIQLAGYLRL